MTSAEDQRKLHNIATVGVVCAVDAKNQTMRLEIGENTTDWVAIPSIAAGGVKVWRCPSVGEQFLLISPSGELANAIAVVSLYSNQNPSPSDDPDEIRISFNENDFARVLVADSKAELVISEVKVKAAERVVFDTPQVHMTGKLKVDGLAQSDTDFVSQNISLTQHKTSGVIPGNGTSGVPIP